MVSWSHSFNRRWQEFSKEYGFVATDVMRSAQTNFGLLDLKDRTFERDLKEWFKRMETKKTPGVFLIAVKGAGRDEEETGSIRVLHHVIILDDMVGPDIVGLESLEASLAFKGAKATELFGKLVPHKGARKAGVSDYFVPSMDGLTDGVHPLKGKFVPGSKDVCANIQSLEAKINGVFVPFPLAQMLLGEEIDLEISDDEESAEAGKTYNPEDPMDLLNRLVRVMSYKKKNQPEWYRDWKSMAQEVVAILWSVGNGFAPGINLLQAPMSRKLIEHQMQCALELFRNDKALYDGETDEVEEGKEEGSQPFGQASPIDKERRISWTSRQASGDEDKSTRQGSPSSKGSQTPSPRKDRPNISFTLQTSDTRSERDDEGESKGEDALEAVHHEVDGGPRPTPARGATRGGDRPAPDSFDGAPKWVEKMAGQLLAGLLATTQALSTAGSAMGEYAEAGKTNLEKKEERKKATSKWLPSGVFLFKILSSEDGWNTQGVPELTEFASQLIEQKIFGATQMIRAKRRALKWPGGLLKPGVGEFLKRGFVSEDVHVGPSGFSVLFFHPSSYADTDSEEFNIQQLNESFGDGKLPEEMMKTFSKLQIWVPETPHDAEEQLETAIKFLKSVCGESTIAVGGYSLGLQHLINNKWLFRSKGTMFLLNYMYMLDRVFQAFCQELMKYELEEDPIQTAKLTGAQGWMEKLVDGPIQTWLVAGTVPIYSPPSAWDDRKFSEGLVDLHSGKGRQMGGSGGGGGSHSPAAKKRKVEKSSGEESKEKDWHKSLDPEEYVKEWFLPEGKNFFSFFSPAKPENYFGFPKVTHHRTGRPAHICLRYIIGNSPKCTRGLSCVRSHIRMSDLSDDEKKTVTKRLQSIYGSTGGKDE